MEVSSTDMAEGFLASKKREYLLVLLLLVIVAVIFTWPLLPHIHEALPGDNGRLPGTEEYGGPGDALHGNWIISWDARTIFHHPTDLFQGNVFYPARDVLAYSEHMFLLGVLGAPVYFLSHNPVLTFNILLLLGLVLSGFGCYLLVKELTGSRWGGVIGGLFFAFCPYRLARTDHLWLVFSAFLPFMLLYLYRYLGAGTKRNLALFALFFLLQSLVGWHYFVFCSLAAGLLWIWTAVIGRGRERWRRLSMAAAAVVVVFLMLIPLLLPYLGARGRLPNYERDPKQVEYFSAKGGDFLRVPPQNVLYGSCVSPLNTTVADRGAALFPGVLIVLLALAGLFLRTGEGTDSPAFDRESYRQGALYFLALTLTALVLSLGPRVGGVSNPFYALPYHLGILKFTRTPMRFFVPAALGLSVLAGYGTARIAARVRHLKLGRALSALLVLLLLLETATFNLPLYDTPVYGQVPEVYTWLGEQGDIRVIELPLRLDERSPGVYGFGREMGFITKDIQETKLRECLSMYFSTYNWKKIANGYSGYFPYSYIRTFTEMQGFPSARSLDLLRGLDIDYVIWHWDWLDGETAFDYRNLLASTPGISEVRDFGGQGVYHVEPGETASPEDLLVDLQAPQSIPWGEEFTISLTVRNTGTAPFVLADEYSHPFTLRFLDQSGNTALEERGECRAPFFLQEGEETSLPLRIEGTPRTGQYRVELVAEGGILDGRSWQRPVSIEDPAALVGTGNMHGSVEVLGQPERLEIPFPDGLFPVEVELANLGDTYWRSWWDEKEAETGSPYGLVFAVITWFREGEAVMGSYAHYLPNDIDAGQSISSGLLVRPPPQPGEYELVIQLVDNDAGPFGLPAVQKVVVKEPGLNQA